MEFTISERVCYGACQVTCAMLSVNNCEQPKIGKRTTQKKTYNTYAVQMCFVRFLSCCPFPNFTQPTILVITRMHQLAPQDVLINA